MRSNRGLTPKRQDGNVTGLKGGKAPPNERKYPTNDSDLNGLNLIVDEAEQEFLIKSVEKCCF